METRGEGTGGKHLNVCIISITVKKMDTIVQQNVAKREMINTEPCGNSVVN